jgi:hypothetical protein
MSWQKKGGWDNKWESNRWADKEQADNRLVDNKLFLPYLL